MLSNYSWILKVFQVVIKFHEMLSFRHSSLVVLKTRATRNFSDMTYTNIESNHMSCTERSSFGLFERFGSLSWV